MRRDNKIYKMIGWKDDVPIEKRRELIGYFFRDLDKLRTKKILPYYFQIKEMSQKDYFRKQMASKKILNNYFKTRVASKKTVNTFFKMARIYQLFY